MNNYSIVKESILLAWNTRLHPNSPIIPLFVSETGLGKTTMVYDAMKDIFNDNHEVVYINLASISPTDFGGFPLIDREKKQVDRVPLEEFNLLLNAKKPTLFFLDEWNRFKDIGMLQVLFNLLRRQIGNKRMSDNIFFIAAENPVEEDSESVYFVIDRDAALYGRILEINLTKDKNAFFEYIRNKTDYDVRLKNAFLGVLDEHNKYFRKISNRDLEKVLVIFSSYSTDMWMDRDSVLYKFISYNINEMFANDMYAMVTDTFVSVKDILEGKFSKEKFEKYADVPYKVLYITMALTEIVNSKLLNGEYTENSDEFRHFVSLLEYVKENHGEIFVSIRRDPSYGQYHDSIKSIFNTKESIKHILSLYDIE